VTARVDPGAARIQVREYGPHLPERNMNSTIYVCEKL